MKLALPALPASLRRIPAPYLYGGAAVLALGALYLLTKKSSDAASTTDASGKTLRLTLSASRPISENQSPGLGQSTENLVLLADMGRPHTVSEVQWLLGAWGARPRPSVTGEWNDATTLAVRDFQTRSGLSIVNGDAFEAFTARALHEAAKNMVLDSYHRVTPDEAQAALGLPITGVDDGSLTSRLGAPLSSPSGQNAAKIAIDRALNPYANL